MPLGNPVAETTPLTAFTSVELVSCVGGALVGSLHIQSQV